MGESRTLVTLPGHVKGSAHHSSYRHERKGLVARQRGRAPPYRRPRPTWVTAHRCAMPRLDAQKVTVYNTQRGVVSPKAAHQSRAWSPATARTSVALDLFPTP